jgi:hypothetical protein
MSGMPPCAAISADWRFLSGWPRYCADAGHLVLVRLQTLLHLAAADRAALHALARQHDRFLLGQSFFACSRDSSVRPRVRSREFDGDRCRAISACSGPPSENCSASACSGLPVAWLAGARLTGSRTSFRQLLGRDVGIGDASVGIGTFVDVLRVHGHRDEQWQVQAGKPVAAVSWSVVFLVAGSRQQVDAKPILTREPGHR